VTKSYWLKCTKGVPAEYVLLPFAFATVIAAAVGDVTTSGMAPEEVVALTRIYAVCSTVVVAAATGVGVSTQEYLIIVALALGLKAVEDTQDGFATADVTLKVVVAGRRVHAVEESFELT
jgi:hypothetical protein